MDRRQLVAVVTGVLVGCAADSRDTASGPTTTTGVGSTGGGSTHEPTTGDGSIGTTAGGETDTSEGSAGTTGVETTGSGTTGVETTGSGTTGVTDGCDGFGDVEPPVCAGTGGGTTGEGTGGGPDGCECIPDDPWTGYLQEVHWPSQPTCGEELCPTVVADCGFSCYECIGSVDDEALDCALTALRDRTPGIIRWSVGENGGQFSYWGYALIMPDGSVVRRRYSVEDLDFVVGDAVHGPAAPACFFDACLALESRAGKLECLLKFWLGQLEICDEGWYGSSL